MEGTRGKLSNDPRDSGTSPPQRAIAEFETGQKVHLRLDPSTEDGRFNPRFHGRTGTVVGTQGDAYKVEVADGDATKTILATAPHLTTQEG